MKKITLSLALLFSASMGYSQIIQNGDFESFNGTPQGGSFNTNVQPQYITNTVGWSAGCATVPNDPMTQGNPYIYSDHANTALNYQPPMGGEIGKRSVANNHSFAGLSGYKNLNGVGASILGTLTEQLSDQYIYKINLWYALGYIQGSTSPYTTIKIEVILRKPGNCQDGKSVFISDNLSRQNEYATGNNPHIVSSNWTNIWGEFALTAAEAAANYTKIEIRINGQTLTNGAGIDDVVMTKRERPKAEYNFSTIGQTYTMLTTPYGPEELTQVCASPAPTKTPVTINGGASSFENGYGIEIRPITVNSTTYSFSGPSIYNAWISTTGQVPTTNININNIPNMQIGQIYLVTLFVGDVNFQSKKSRLFRINPLPTINAGADATICTADGVNITTSNWPVQVSKNSVTIGNYSSNPIMLPASASATYSFRATNSFGCMAQDNAVLTMKACSRASFVFKNPIATETSSSPYGPTTITHLCAPYKIDGSASVNEDGYFLHVQRFDVPSYQMLGSPLINQWVGTGGQQAGNDINLSALMTGFTIGHTYIVGLSVGPDWHSDTKFFKAVACAKSGNSEESLSLDEVALEELDLLVFPNPNNGLFTVSFENQTVKYLEVTDLAGKSVFSTDVPNDASAVNIDLTDLTNGVYLVNVRQANGEIIVKKIIKN